MSNKQVRVFTFIIDYLLKSYHNYVTPLPICVIYKFK